MNLVWGLQGKKEIGVEKAGTEGGAGEGRPTSPHRHCHRKGDAPEAGETGVSTKSLQRTNHKVIVFTCQHSPWRQEVPSSSTRQTTDEETDSERPGELCSTGSYHGLR